MGRAAWLVCLLYAGCVNSTSVICADGSTCPGGFQCDVDGRGDTRCLIPEQISACNGLEEGDDCSFNGTPGACRDRACEVFFCGDGYITGNEVCDSANLGIDERTMETADCITAGYYGVAGLACNGACNYETKGCEIHGWCGDEEANGQELCDGSTNKTCISIGFDAGSVTCDSQCGLAIRDCSRFGWNPESISDVVANAVAGSGPDDQWAFGLNGRAMRYEGAFWNSVPTGVTNTLIAGWSITKTNAWALGQSRASPPLAAVVIRWDGTAWSPVSDVPAGEYVDVWAASATAVFIATKSAVLQYNGTSWSTVGTFSGEPKTLRGSSATDVWATTSLGLLLRWTGSTWENRSTHAKLVGLKLEFVDVNSPADVWAIGYLTATPGTGVIVHWDGADWTKWQTNSETYNQVASSGPNDAWVAGVDGIMRHWDGTAWSKSTNIGASPSGLTALAGLISLGPAEVVGVSTLNLAYRYRGQAFGVFPPIGPNPFDAIQNLAMWSIAANESYVTNVNGQVLRYNGVSWSVVFTVPQVLGADQPARGLWASASDDVWVGANDGRMYQFNGSTWTPHDVATTPIKKVWGSGVADDIWAFTDVLAFHKTGATWTSYVLGTATILSVSGSGPDDLYAVDGGTPHKLWHWNGTMWSEVVTGASFPMLAVAAITPTDVHVSAQEGRMLHWNGSTWSETIVASLAELTFMTASAADDVIAASERDLFHYNGFAWAAVRTPVDFVPNTSDYIPLIGIHALPGRIDILLQRYRIRTLIRTRPLVCRVREMGSCDDGVDNDCDGALDSVDDECP